ASNGGVGSTVEWTAPANDEYFVVVAPPPQVSDPVGTYGLKVEANQALEDRRAPGDGQMAEG
ncbi:MAG: hypothetical protein QGH94_00415, partial [Phycisphaerae bacterium]|nr:hypothetical protein [Phycisphaerae bacterium]